MPFLGRAAGASATGGGGVVSSTGAVAMSVTHPQVVGDTPALAHGVPPGLLRVLAEDGEVLQLVVDRGLERDVVRAVEGDRDLLRRRTEDVHGDLVAEERVR